MITDIQIVDWQLSVSAGASPSSDFNLNLLDTDLEGGFEYLCELLNRYYYPRSIYIYETSASCGC